MPGFGDSPAEFLIRFPVPCVESVITSHLEMLFGDMLDEKGDEIQYRDSFLHIGIILMFIIMESHIFPIVRIDTGSSNDRTAEVAADIFNDCISITEIRLGINIETIFIFLINLGFGFLKRGAYAGFEFVQESGLKGFPEISIVKILHNFPEAVIRKTALSEEAVDMGIPLQGSAESVEDTDKTGDKVFTLIHIMKESEDDTADSLEKAVEKGAVVQKERPQVFVDGKNEVSVSAVNKFKRHSC